MTFWDLRYEVSLREGPPEELDSAIAQSNLPLLGQSSFSFASVKSGHAANKMIPAVEPLSHRVSASV